MIPNVRYDKEDTIYARKRKPRENVNTKIGNLRQNRDTTMGKRRQNSDTKMGLAKP